jgi:beta-phosphoglucomutase-like phosphatase (HAD superfamily)
MRPWREEKRRFDAVIWDIDGTLIDSEPLHYAALLAVCGRHGCRVGAAENRRMLGLSLVDVWELLRAGHGLAVDCASWGEEIVDYYRAHVHASMTRPGVREMIGGLERLGVHQGCVSTAERRIVLTNLQAVGVREQMECLISREDVRSTKPDPEPYLAAVAALGLPPHRCLAIEDTVIGCTSARAAGVAAVAWPNAMSAGMDFAAADCVIQELPELPMALFRED